MRSFMNFAAIFFLLIQVGGSGNLEQSEFQFLFQSQSKEQTSKQGISTLGNKAAAFSQWQSGCHSYLPPFEVILENPDTVLRKMKDLELECVFNLLKQAEIRILHQKDPKAFELLEACFTVFDASYSTALSGTFKQLWLNQDTFFLRQVMKSSRENILGISKMIIDELELDLATNMDFEKKLNKLDKQVYDLPLNWEEKSFVKQIHEIALERAKIKQVFRTYLLLRDDYENHWKISDCDNEDLELRASGKALNDFTEDELFPIFPIVSHHICDYQDDEVFSGLMKVIISSPGSAAEDLSDILGEIFICRTDFMIDYAVGHEEYYLIIDHINFGFLNSQYQNADQSSLLILSAKLDSLNEVKPFRNY